VGLGDGHLWSSWCSSPIVAFTDWLSGGLAREVFGLAAQHSSHVAEQDPPVGGPFDVVAEPATIGFQVWSQTRRERVDVQEGGRAARERPAASFVELPDRSQLGQQRVEPVEVVVADKAQVAVRRRRQVARSS
jgi:hypothetical protein